MIDYSRTGLLEKSFDWHLEPIGCRAELCILTAGVTPLSKLTSIAGRIPPSTLLAWMGSIVHFFFNHTTG